MTIHIVRTEKILIFEPHVFLPFLSLNIKPMLSGMKIIGSVCDQTQTNAAAVNYLVNPNLQKGKYK